MQKLDPIDFRKKLEKIAKTNSTAKKCLSIYSEEFTKDPNIEVNYRQHKVDELCSNFVDDLKVKIKKIENFNPDLVTELTNTASKLNQTTLNTDDFKKRSQGFEKMAVFLADTLSMINLTKFDDATKKELQDEINRIVIPLLKENTSPKKIESQLGSEMEKFTKDIAENKDNVNVKNQLNKLANNFAKLKSDQEVSNIKANTVSRSFSK